jgi:hypothetical protein
LCDDHIPPNPFNLGQYGEGIEFCRCRDPTPAAGSRREGFLANGRGRWRDETDEGVACFRQAQLHVLAMTLQPNPLLQQKSQVLKNAEQEVPRGRQAQVPSALQVPSLGQQ